MLRKPLKSLIFVQDRHSVSVGLEESHNIHKAVQIIFTTLLNCKLALSVFFFQNWHNGARFLQIQIYQLFLDLAICKGHCKMAHIGVMLYSGMYCTYVKNKIGKMSTKHKCSPTATPNRAPLKKAHLNSPDDDNATTSTLTFTDEEPNEDDTDKVEAIYFQCPLCKHLRHHFVSLSP